MYLLQKKQESKQKCKQIIAQDRHDIMVQNAKISNSKKVQHSFCHCRTKKERKNTREKTKAKCLCIQYDNTNGITKNLRKRELFAQQHRSKPGQWCQRWKLSKKIFLPTRSVNFLKQKIWPIRRHQNIGCFTAKWRHRDPPHCNIHRHKQFSPQRSLRAMKKRPKVFYVDFYEEYENPG